MPLPLALFLTRVYPTFLLPTLIRAAPAGYLQVKFTQYLR